METQRTEEPHQTQSVPEQSPKTEQAIASGVQGRVDTVFFDTYGYPSANVKAQDTGWKDQQLVGSGGYYSAY